MTNDGFCLEKVIRIEGRLNKLERVIDEIRAMLNALGPQGDRPDPAPGDWGLEENNDHARKSLSK